MKTLSALLLLLGLSLTLMSQQPASIIFKVTGGAHKVIRHASPVHGVYFPEFPIVDTLDANGELVLPNNEKVAGAYLFFYKKTYRLYIVPGAQYKVTINEANKEVHVEGPDQEGQLALLNLSWEFYQMPGVRLYRGDSVFANNKQKVLYSMDSCLQPFNSLYKQHAITKDFYSYAQSCIKNYYASVLGAALMEPTRKVVAKINDKDVVRQINDQWQEILKIANVTDPKAIATDTYLDYFNLYNLWYVSYFKTLVDNKPMAKKIDYDEYRYNNVDRYIEKEPLREYLLACGLKSFVVEEHFQIYIPDFYKDFLHQYPHSRFIPYLADGVERVKDFYAHSKNEFSPGQRFIADYDQIGSVDSLLLQFKGKTIYIDMWATWCGPCKAQFAFKNELDSVLKSKGVEVLYISIDKADAEQTWKNMIKYYDLEGYHIRASEKLMKDIYNVFTKDKALTIPRYAIVKDGKIVLLNAKRPGEKDALYKQIESFL